MPISLSGSLNLSGSLTTTGTITATTLVVQTITSSISSITGSTNFGSISANTHVFTGSMSVSGSGNFTSDLSGTSATFSNNGLFGGSTNPGNAGTYTLSVGLAGTNTGGIQLWSPTNSAHYIQFGDSITAADNYRGYVGYNHATDTLSLGTAAADRVTIASTGAATFLSSVTAASGLYNGYTSGLPPTSGSATRGGLRLNNASNIALDFGTVAAGQAWLQVSDANNYASNFALLLNPNGGNVGIGTNSPSSKLYVRTTAGATKAYDDLSKTNIMCFDDTSMVEGVGGSITFGGYKTSTSAGGNFAAIDGIKENGTAGNEAGAFRIWTANSSGVFGERMRITSGGNVGIGTSSPVESLQVTGNIRASNRYYINDGTNTLEIGANYIQAYLNAGASSTNLAFYTGTAERMRITSAGYLFFGTTTNSGFSATSRFRGPSSTENTDIISIDGGVEYSGYFRAVSGANYSSAGTAIIIGRNTSTGRSINAGGTINASGTDYAEYMLKAIQDNISKGDIVGVDENGLLTNIFADAKSFVVKSTNPSYVGGDTWGSVDIIGKLPTDATDEQKAEYESKLEEARTKVDRIAFSGQVPCNVYNAQVGDYIIPIELNGKISGQAISNPTFEQYQISVGKVWKIMEDGRAWIAVKIG